MCFFTLPTNISAPPVNSISNRNGSIDDCRATSDLFRDVFATADDIFRKMFKTAEKHKNLSNIYTELGISETEVVTLLSKSSTTRQP